MTYNIRGRTDLTQLQTKCITVRRAKAESKGTVWKMVTADEAVGCGGTILIIDAAIKSAKSKDAELEVQEEKV